jgi:hypothetical protein
MDMSITGQVGDFIGGVVGTIISAAGFVFLYLTLQSQNVSINYQKEVYENERIESRFFALLQLHRNNVEELSFRTWEDGQEKSSGRKVFKDIYYQLHYAVELCHRCLEGQDLNKILSENSFIKTYSSDNHSTHQLLIANLAYATVFFGVARESIEGLRNVLKKDFQEDFIIRFIDFIKVIPEPKSTFWENWDNTFSSSEFELQVKGHIDGPPSDPEVAQAYNLRGIFSILKGKKYYKFFGGHQSKLGHYYRHLYRTIDYIDSKPIDFPEKNEYIRVLRAQLSNYEQYLLFFNSVSFIGRAWELNHKNDSYHHWISKYDMIRNIPYTRFTYKVKNDEHVIELDKFYPLVAYEFEAYPELKKDFIERISKQDEVKIKFRSR